ncbi:MAG: hypothetical protein K6B65_00565 [Bacilli bacterium]|nr:hypothetical protein [Bacilli bacterium]
MNQKRRSALERDIVTSLRRYRLQEEIRIIEEEKAATAATSEKETKKGFVQTVKSMLKQDVRDIKSKVTGDDLPKAKKNLEDFEASVEDPSSTDYTTDIEDFKRILDVYFDRDGGSARLSMALELGFDEFDQEKPKFLRTDKSRESLSSLLLGDPKKLGEMLAFYSYSYRQIGAPKANTFSKGFLIGLTAGSLAMFGIPLFLFGAFRSKAAMAAAGGVAAVGASELLLFSTLVGSGFIKKNKYKRKSVRHVKAMAKNCLDTEIACSIATALTLYEFSAKEDEEKAKETLDLLIKMVDDIRADAEFMGLVERVNTKENLKKIVVCDNAINHIGKLILGEAITSTKGEESPKDATTSI